MTTLTLAALTLAIWIYLIVAHGGFWRGREREDFPIRTAAADETWPAVTVIIPARNEADVLPRCLASLIAQDYAGALSILVVDDQSDDGTGDIVRKAASGAPRPVDVLTAPERPAGWTGKVWAQNVGIEHAEKSAMPSTYYLLTDADITYEPNSLTALVRRAKAQGSVLTSLMAKLNCESFAEKMLVPAFVYFFQMLYPFAFANRAKHFIAAAAGGCMLADRAALKRAGGMEAIRSALIDDCSLARVMKRQGPIWIGLAETVRSIREYPAIEDIRKMVSRSAYAQLHYSLVLLAGTTVGLFLVFLAAPLLTLGAERPANLLASLSWVLMSWSFQPTLRYYGQSWVWGPLLPFITVLYLAFTLDSAYQHLLGRGGMWKGRSQAARK